AESAEALKAIGFEGYAIGGLAVGEGQEAMFGVLDYAPAMLPEDKPRYLMGVGKPDDIVGAVKRGVDMMDCVLPSRSGRTGQAWTRRYYQEIMAGMRAAIAEGRFDAWEAEFHAQRAMGDIEPL
ncbi:MAG: tRNA-guanine transglycosylase, partial [Maritimibacter sp.]